VESLGKGKLSSARLENALEKVEAQRVILAAREQEIQNKISQAEIQEFDYKLIQENLRKFQDTFSALTDQEKPECLQMILKDVVLGKDTVQLNIFDLPHFSYADSSKNRTERLPI
jgi:hypothetical protein